MVSINIKLVMSSPSSRSAEIEENMEMSMSVSVIFSRDDTFRSQRCDMVMNVLSIKSVRLGIGEEDISGMISESRALAFHVQNNVIAHGTWNMLTYI